MSSRELIASLRKSGDERTLRVKQDAERQAAALDEAAEKKLRDLRETCAAKLSSLAGEADLRAAVTAGIEARRITLLAEQETARRLFAAALHALPQLRNEGYPAVLAKLAAELSEGPWASVRVNPADVEPARRMFPDAEIVPVDDISGGLDATSPGGAIRVINTFEKRLERIWKDLLPALMQELYGEAPRGTAPRS